MLRSIVDSVQTFPNRYGRVSPSRLIPELDGLRCLAILLVLMWHASLRAARYSDSLGVGDGRGVDLYRYFPHGEIGVALFFSISGFVVSQPFLRRQQGDRALLDFYQRRIIRIYPPYLVTMLLCWTALAVVGHTPSDAYGFQQGEISLNSSLVASLGFMHAIIFDSPSRLNPPMWSIEVEMIFYLLIPFILRVYLLKGARMTRILGLLAVIALLVNLTSMIPSSEDIDIRGRWAFLYHVFLFLMGIALADVGLQTGEHGRYHRYDALFAAGSSLLVVDGLLLTAANSRMLNWSHAMIVQILMVAAIAAMFAGALKGRAISWVLSQPWVGLIGVMCYSIYLTHIVTMTVVTEMLQSYLRPTTTWSIYASFLFLNISMSLIVGSVFYLVVERRFLVARRPKGNAAVLAAEA